MSATGIIGSAISALNANQVALRNTSTNIANVNNPDYARREAVFETRSLGGVDITEIRRIANDFLSREAYGASSATGAASSVARLHDRLQGVFGDPSANTSIPGALDAMFGELADLQLDPASSIARATAVTGIELMLAEVGRVASTVQDVRLDADRDILARVPVINDLLRNIHQLNMDIVLGASGDQDVNGLIDQRQKSLNELAELIDIRVSPQPNGGMSVSTSDGTFLVSNVLTELQYSGAGISDPDVVFPRITLHIVDAASGDVSATGTLFEPHLAGGELRGLLDMRDTVLPGVAEEVGELAAKIADQLNAVHNNSSAVPAPTTLVGRNTGLVGTDAHGFTGATNFSVLDASGQTLVTVRADFSANQFSVNGGAPAGFGGTSLADAVAAINGALGASGSLSLTGGVMTLSASNSANGVAMLQDTAAPSSRAGRGFAHYFGLNDLVGASAPSHYETGLVSTQAHGFGAGQTLQMKFINSDGQQAIDYTLNISGTSFDDILNQLNNTTTGMGQFLTFGMDANGAVSATPNAGFSDYTLFVADDQTDRGGTGLSLSQLFGLGPGARQLQAAGMSVRSDIVADKSKLALAQLDITAVGDIALAVGDERGALALHGVENQLVQFDAAGTLASTRLTLSDFSGQFIANAAQAASQADVVSADRLAIRDEIYAQIGQVSGVNLDEELANLIVFQNAYNAAARLIRAAEELLETLLSVV